MLAVQARSMATEEKIQTAKKHPVYRGPVFSVVAKITNPMNPRIPPMAQNGPLTRALSLANVTFDAV